VSRSISDHESIRALADDLPVDTTPVEPGTGTILVVDDDVMVRRAVSITSARQ
jgi:hypothetical protein